MQNFPSDTVEYQPRFTGQGELLGHCNPSKRLRSTCKTYQKLLKQPMINLGLRHNLLQNPNRMNIGLPHGKNRYDRFHEAVGQNILLKSGGIGESLLIRPEIYFMWHKNYKKSCQQPIGWRIESFDLGAIWTLLLKEVMKTEYIT